MAEDGEGELPSVDHGPLNEGPWEKGIINFVKKFVNKNMQK